jgi:hypothetical protein
MVIENNIEAIIDEMYAMPDRAFIPRHEEIVALAHGVQISRKSIKYIIDSRKDDNYGIERIKKMFKNVPEVFNGPGPDFSTPTQKYSIVTIVP